MEIWNAYKKDGTPAGRDLIRGQAIDEGLYHLVSEVTVKHKDGSYLFMQRDYKKETFPGLYECSAGGSVLKGESPEQGARRELKEETGIICGNLVPIYKVIDKNTIYHGYLAEVDCDKDSIVLQKGETISHLWLYESDFFSFIESDKYVRTHRNRLKEYLNSLNDKKTEILQYGIMNSDKWVSVKKIYKGWSSESKYLIKDCNNEKYILRISDIADYAKKKHEYGIIKKFSTLDFEMSKPVDFGICNNGKNTYMVLSWVEGEDLEEALNEMSEKEQYEAGWRAGKILKQIHSIIVDDSDINNESKEEKMLHKIDLYLKSGVRVEGDEAAVNYVRDHVHEINRLPKVYQHGDFHPGNLIHLCNSDVGVIDFNRNNVGDAYEEFFKLESFAVEVSIPYCRGQIDAYFDKNVPEIFWRILSVYVAYSSLNSIRWAIKFGQDEVDGMIRRCKASLEHYDNYKRIIPSWYSEE